MSDPRQIQQVAIEGVINSDGINFPGRSALCALRPILKHFSPRRVVLPARLSASAYLAMFVESAWNTRSHMMSVSVFGEASPNVSVVA